MIPYRGEGDFRESIEVFGSADCIPFEAGSGGFTLKGFFCTVPSRLTGHRLRARLFRQHIDLFFGLPDVMTLPRIKRQPGPSSM